MSSTSATPAIGTVAANVNANFSALAQLVTAGSYLAGMGFAVGAVLKFKGHKDNPTQIPIGTSAALDAVSAALLYLPTAASTTGVTAADVEAKAQSAAASAGVPSADVAAAGEKAKAAAASAGVSSADVAAGKAAVQGKLSG